MRKYLVSRLVRSVLTLFAAATLTFVVLRCMPSDPVSVIVNDSFMNQADVDRLMHEFGLDQPRWTQYLLYLKNLCAGNLGVSFSTRRPVLDMLLERLPWTMLLVTAVMVNSLLLGVLLGTLAADHRGRWQDHLINAAAVIGTSVFVPSAGVFLLYFFGVKLSILPIGGAYTPGTAGFARILDVAHHLVLPVATLTIVNLAGYVLYVRTSLSEVLQKEYIRTAQSKGMPHRRVVWVHGVRNTLVPTVTMGGILAGNLVGGSLLTETIYSYPGLGRLIYEAVGKMDYPVLQGAFLMLAATVIVIGIVTDLLYLHLNPKIRLE